jgi:hypothetical protein
VLLPRGRLRPKLDPQLAAIVHRALAHRREHRFQSVRELADALGSCGALLDAPVFVDGQPQGKAPIKALVVNAGEHTLRAVHHGSMASERITVSSGTAATVNLVVEPSGAAQAARATSRIVLACPVPDVWVQVDGLPRAGPLSNGGSWLLPAGSRRVTFQRAGYRPQTHAVVLGPDQTREVNCQLVPSRKLLSSETGVVEVVGGDSALQVAVDGVAGRQARVPPGRHRVEIVDPVLGKALRMVTVAAGRKTVVQLAPEQDQDPAASSGRPDQRTAALVTGTAGLALGASAIAAFLVAVISSANTSVSRTRWRRRRRPERRTRCCLGARLATETWQRR